jgi:predicted peptidase
MKYPQRWAAIAPIAPAAFGRDPKGVSKIPKMPIMLVHGDMDTAVPVSLAHSWVDVMTCRR